jgi:hypothetical protein
MKNCLNIVVELSSSGITVFQEINERRILSIQLYNNKTKTVVFYAQLLASLF